MMNNKVRSLRCVLTACFWVVATTGHSVILSRLEQGQSLTISAIGTSLTAESANYGNGLWFNKMGAWLNAKYPGKVTLDNEAYGGACSQTTAGTYGRNGLSAQDGGAGQLDRALAHSPDAIFIEFGMNDAVTQFTSVYPPVGITPVMLRNNLQTMVDKINSQAASQKRSVDIVIMTMNDEPTSGKRANLPNYYQACRDAAKDNGLLLIDNYPDWVHLRATQTTMQSYVPDGVHPNELGTDTVIMPNVEKSLLGQVPEPQSKTMLVGAGMIALLACVWRKQISTKIRARMVTAWRSAKRL